jgi:DnaJ-class molecular chaperone
VSVLAVAQASREAPDPQPTLDEVLAGAWAGLRRHRTVECPVCHGEMAPRYGAHTLPVGGRCKDCGATLG